MLERHQVDPNRYIAANYNDPKTPEELDQEHRRAADKAALRTRRIDIRSAPAYG